MFKFSKVRGTKSKQRDSGYMLLLLMLAVAVLTITMLGVAKNYRQSIVRDREVEMMHRGDQYARAVKRFYKKNGRYPSSIEQLENTNNIRYLRKRYKDPMSPDGAWKLVHATDIKLSPGTGLTSSGPTGAGGVLAGQAAAGNINGNALGATSQSAGASDSSASQGTLANPAPADKSTSDTGTGSSSSAFGASSGADTSSNSNAAGGQVLGGGDVYGVVSKNQSQGIHIFNEKKKYNEWFFIFVQTQNSDRLLVGPYNPNMSIGLTNPTQGNSSSNALGTGNSSTPSSTATTPADGSTTPINSPTK